LHDASLESTELATECPDREGLALLGSRIGSVCDVGHGPERSCHPETQTASRLCFSLLVSEWCVLNRCNQAFSQLCAACSPNPLFLLAGILPTILPIARSSTATPATRPAVQPGRFVANHNAISPQREARDYNSSACYRAENPKGRAREGTATGDEGAEGVFSEKETCPQARERGFCRVLVLPQSGSGMPRCCHAAFRIVTVRGKGTLQASVTGITDNPCS
jgi:hypothetical protein